MAAKKRASTQSKLLNRAVTAGRSALRQAQRRLPPDVRRQIDKTVKDGQKTFHTAIRQVETRLDRTARQADLDRAMKRLDELSRQVRAMASAAAEARTRPMAATRKASTRKMAKRKPSTQRKAATGVAKATTPRKRTKQTPRKSGGPGSASPRSSSNGS